MTASNAMLAEAPAEAVPRDPVKDMAILEALGQAKAKDRQKAIDARVNQGIDQRWFGDVEAHEGRDEVTRHYAGLRDVVQGYITAQDPRQQKRSTIIINVTRGKVNAAVARLQDIALPTDDRNWDIRPSTVPELVEQMSQKHLGLVKDGKPVMVTENGQQRQATMADLAQRDLDKAKKAAVAMRDEIDDQLDLSNDGSGYEGVVRAVMEDHELLGVGVGKGPVVTSRVKQVWMPITDGERTVHVLQRIQDIKPGSSRVNPWDIYPHPECGEHPKKFPIWERLPGVTAADLRGYADIPGYLPEQIRKVLIEGPRKPDSPANKPGENPVVTAETVYEAWEYHGDIGREELMAAGCTCSEDDVWTSYSGCLVMVNDTVIKADIEILDTNEMPYDFFVTNKCSGSWAGYGTAFLARSAQKVITAAWRSMMDNAGQYIGSQTVMHRGKLVPADGKWEVKGPKLWWYNGNNDGADMGKLFAVHNIPAHQEEYAAIIKMGMDFLDNETAIPQLAQGEQGQATDVLGGMNLLLNASNVMIRRKLKCFDDQFTIPHIGRYVDWNMQYNKKSEIKGDFEVQARASGQLFDTEIQNKSAGDLVAIIKDPAFSYGMKKWDAVRRFVRSRRFDPKDFVKTDDEIKTIEDKMAQNPQADPRVEVAKIRVEADAQIEQMRQQFEAKENEAERQNKLVIAAIDERLKSTELTSSERETLAKIKGTLAGKAIEINAQKQITRDNQLLDLHKDGANRAERRQDVIKKTGAEPPGRAKKGQAFTQ